MQLNTSAIALFNRILANTSSPDVQRDWWSQHAPLTVVANPPGSGCQYKAGCRAKFPAHVRCDASAASGRAAVWKLQWPFCSSILDAVRANTARRGEERSVVYSVGINNEWQFDDRMAGLGYEVHSFDPSTKTRAAHEQHATAGVRFHYIGLTGSGPVRLKDRSVAHYGALGGEMLTWGALTERMGHRTVSVAKVDCEGCEVHASAVGSDGLALRAPCRPPLP